MRRLIAITMFLTACGTPEPADSDQAGRWMDSEPEEPPPTCPDSYAGFELCNGVDDDGDGEVDEADALDARPWFTDADGDEWGDPESVVVSCTQPPGTIDRGGDCDDSDATLHPLQAELCDGINNDCDSLVDESPEDGVLAYLDPDGDGWGRTIETSLGEDAGARWCEMPEGYVEVGGDCDEVDATINPGAVEICGDGIDQNCDGQDDECAR
jgi:hypothetical protein